MSRRIPLWRRPIVCAIACALGLSACGNGNDEPPGESIGTTGTDVGLETDAGEAGEAPSIASQVSVGGGAAGPIAVAEGSVFVVNEGALAVFPETESPSETARVPLPSSPYELTAGEGAVWAASEEGIDEVDPANLSSRSAVIFKNLQGAGRIAVGDGFVFGQTNGGTTRLDLSSGAEREVRGVSVDAVGEGAAWGGRGESPFVARINPGTVTEEAAARVPDYVFDIEVGEGKVWAATGDESVTGIDPATNQVVAGPTTVPNNDSEVGVSVLDVAVGLGGVWVGDAHALSVHRVDPSTGEITDTLPLARAATGGEVFVAVGADAVWAASTDASGTGVTLSRIDPGTTAGTTTEVPTSPPPALTATDRDEMSGIAREFILYVAGGPLSSVTVPSPPDQETCSVNAPPLTQEVDRNPATAVLGEGFETCLDAVGAASEQRCVPEYVSGEASGDGRAAEFDAAIGIELRDRDGLPSARGSAHITLNFVKPLNDWLVDGTSPKLAELCDQIARN